MGKRRDEYVKNHVEEKQEVKEMETKEKDNQVAPDELKEMLIQLSEVVDKEVKELKSKIDTLDKREGDFDDKVLKTFEGLNTTLKEREGKLRDSIKEVRKDIPASSGAAEEAIKLQAQKVSELESKIASLETAIGGLQDKIAMALSAVAQPVSPAPEVKPEHKLTTYERANPKEPQPEEIRTFYVCKAGDYSVCQESEELAREIANTIEPGKKHDPVRVAAWVDESGKFVRNLNTTELVNLELVK